MNSSSNPTSDEILSQETAETAEISQAIEFKDLGLNKDLEQSIYDNGFKNPTPIQEKAIPEILAKKDMIAQAATGTGKTAVFALSMIHRILENEGTQVLVLTPTRELAQQVLDEFRRFGQSLGIKTTGVVGGASYEQQIKGINRGCDVVVATPGRMLDHLKANVLRNFSPDVIILDEADEMLDMGFIEDIRNIFTYAKEDRQTLFFSATMPQAIKRLAQKELKDPVHINMIDGFAKTNEQIEQSLFIIKEQDRLESFCRLIQYENPEKSIVFCRTKMDTEELAQSLRKKGIHSLVLHGDMSQNERKRVMQEIKEGELKILIATDVASRGIDISSLSHVFNYHLPQNKERYTHRIGRTGRAGTTGKAFSFASPSEWSRHGLFRSLPRSNFTLGSLPKRSEIESLLNERFIDAVREMKVDANAKKFFPKIENQQELMEFFEKLYSYNVRDISVDGPEEIFQQKDLGKPDQSSSRSRGRGRSRSRGDRDFAPRAREGRSSGPRPSSARPRSEGSRSGSSRSQKPSFKGGRKPADASRGSSTNSAQRNSRKRA